jgi:hypothetical protein
VGGIALLILATAIGILVSRRTGQKPAVATAEPPKAGVAVPAAAPGPAAPSVTANPTAVPPVITAADSLAIAETVRKRLAQAAAAKTPGQTAINADSLKQRIQREVTDSVARAKAALAAVSAPVAPPVLPTAPAASGPRRLAIAEPGESKEQPAINTFSRALSDALRGSLSKGDTFAAIDQDSVRGVLGHTDSRDEAVKILHPDVLVSQSYTGAGDTVKISVSVRDLRPGSTYGIHLISARVMPAYPQYYLTPIVQAVLKQLDDLSRAPSIFGR